jgi:hypothetical protein
MRHPITPRLYHVHLTTGPIELYAVTQAQAISSALELMALALG